MNREPTSTPTYLLADVLGQIDTNISERKAGRLPPLDARQRAEIVTTVESAMQTRERAIGGSDPLAQELNKVPERHHYAAMAVARTLAAYDGGKEPNPFQHDQLQRVYDSERAYMRHIAERTPKTGVTYQGPIVSADERYVVQSVGKETPKLIQHDRTLLSCARNDLIKEGAKVEIRYLTDRVAVVREWGDRQLNTPASKSLEMRVFGG